MIVSIRLLLICCATSAHGPKPWYASAMPIPAEAMVPPKVEKKNFLNCRWRETYALSTDLKELIKKVKLMTLMTGIKISLSYRSAIMGAVKNITAYNTVEVNSVVKRMGE